jgi:hypothetical protein
MRKSNPSSNLAFAAVAIFVFSGIALGQYDPVSQLICNPSSVTSGMATSCTVTLTAAAPSGGAKVLLSSDNALLPLTVSSLTIPAGSASATFTVTAGSIGSSESATLTATAPHLVTLNWTASVSPNLTNYNVYRGASSGGPYNLIANAGLATSYGDYNVQNGLSYYYVTTAVDDTGQESPYSNQAVVAVPNGVSQTATVSLVGQSATPGWRIVGVGDFNGDGYADVLWFNGTTGSLSEWLLDGHGNVIGNLGLSMTCGSGCYPQWQVVGVGDLNGDGHADVLWFNGTTGSLSEWLLDGHGNVIGNLGLSRTCGPGCYPQWQVVGVGDFNGDGHADILWFNGTTGVLGEWLLDGRGNVIATPPGLSMTCGPGCYPQWQAVGVGDLNGDGHADVLWFNGTIGSLSEWLLDGNGNVIGNLGLSMTCGPGCYPQWQVAGVGDFNGDGHADVLWFNTTTGVLCEWLLDGHGNVIGNLGLSMTCGPGCYSSSAKAIAPAPANAGQRKLF